METVTTTDFRVIFKTFGLRTTNLGRQLSEIKDREKNVDRNY
jgi:hypothetical protein